MAKNVIMPALGMAQETGILLQWLRQPGEIVTKGEALMEVETDKATVEIEAPASGMLQNVTAAAGDEVPVGQIIAVIVAPGEASPPPQASPAQPPQIVTSVAAGDPPAKSPSVSPVAARIAAENNIDVREITPQYGTRVQKADVLAWLETARVVPTASPRVLASPKARRLAAEIGLDLALVAGSGPAGAVSAADVTAAAAAPPPTPAAVPTAVDAATLPMNNIWRVAARRVTDSWTTTPHFYLNREVDAGQLIAWRQAAQARLAEKITFTDLLTKLLALTLSQYPRLNGMWRDGDIVLNEEINIGLAVAIEAGLTVPVIRRANQLSLQELARQRQTLVAKAQAGKLSAQELSDGTFTISNLGMYGIDSFSPIINPPQAAILAVGRIAERVVAVNGRPVVQPRMALTLSCDHRVVDGAGGAQFMQTLVEFIEEPLRTLK